MFEFWNFLIDTEGWPPRWFCGQWTPTHGWTYILANLAVWSAYMSIPLTLVYFFRKRGKKLPYPWILLMFAAFIFACGTTHMLDALAFWWPAYRLMTVANVITALVSWSTVFALIWLVPRALQLKSTQELEEEVAERTTALQEAQQRLQQLTERYELAIWGASDGIWDWDIQKNELYMSARFLEIIGRTIPEDQRTFQAFLNDVHPDDQALIQKALESHFERNEPYDVEFRYQHPSGTLRYLTSRGKATRDVQGHPVRMAGAITDITERKQSEANLKRLSDSGLMGIFFADVHGNIWDANETVLEMTGYTREEILEGRVRWDEITPAEYLEKDYEAVRELQARGSCTPYDKQYIRKDGSRVDVVIGFAFLEGSTEKTICFVLDISRLKEAQRALIEAEERFRMVIDATNSAVWDWNLITGEVYWSPRFYDMVGLSPDEISPSYDGFISLVAQEDRPLIESHIHAHLNDPNQKFEVEFRIRHAQGHLMHWLGAGAALRDSAGTPYRMLGVEIDISDIARTRSKLQAALNRETLVRQVVETINHSLDIRFTIYSILEDLCRYLDVDRAILFFYENADTPETLDFQLFEQFCRQNIQPLQAQDLPIRLLKTLQPQKDSPHPSFLVQYSSPQDFPEEYRTYAQIYNVQSVVVMEFSYRDEAYGRLVLHQCQFERTWSEEEIRLLETITRHIGVAVYQSNLFQNEKQARQAAEEANKRKSQFLANMSHELRTPLNAVIGYSEMLDNGLAGALNEKQHRYIDNITSSGKHLLTLVNDILDLSKIEAGKFRLSIEPVDVMPLVDELKGVLDAMALKQDVELHFDIAPGLTLVHVDASRLKQIFYNLISNAIKFNKPHGQVYIRFYPSEDNLWVIGEVEDTGEGIPKSRHGELFKTFQQLDSSSNKTQEGTGLGLALTKHLVELHGGLIWFTSEVGQGSTFSFKLPMFHPSGQLPEAHPSNQLVSQAFD